MSAISDPDRLERLAGYMKDDPPNTSPREVADAFVDAAERIRSLQGRLEAIHAALDQCDIDQRRGRSYVSVAALVCVSAIAKAVGR